MKCFGTVIERTYVDDDPCVWTWEIIVDQIDKLCIYEIVDYRKKSQHVNIEVTDDETL